VFGGCGCIWLHTPSHANKKRREKFGEKKARTSPTLPAEGPDADPLPSSASSHTLGSVQLAAARTHAVMMASVMVWSLEVEDAMTAGKGRGGETQKKLPRVNERMNVCKGAAGTREAGREFTQHSTLSRSKERGGWAGGRGRRQAISWGTHEGSRPHLECWLWGMCVRKVVGEAKIRRHARAKMTLCFGICRPIRSAIAAPYKKWPWRA
jgi:hypothetical protein